MSDPQRLALSIEERRIIDSLLASHIQETNRFYKPHTKSSNQDTKNMALGVMEQVRMCIKLMGRLRLT
jgi:hypothetical protein